MILYATDHKLGDSLEAVYDHFMRKASDANYPAAYQAKMQHLTHELQKPIEDIQRMVDMIRDNDGKEQDGVATIVGRYSAFLSPV